MRLPYSAAPRSRRPRGPRGARAPRAAAEASRRGLTRNRSLAHEAAFQTLRVGIAPRSRHAYRMRERITMGLGLGAVLYAVVSCAPAKNDAVFPEDVDAPSGDAAAALDGTTSRSDTSAPDVPLDASRDADASAPTATSAVLTFRND